MKESLVIIPTYNEIDNIEDIIRTTLSVDPVFDILIVDDGSPDGTASIVKKIQKEFPERIFLIERSGKLGLGTAYITGFKYALENAYQLIYEMDADFSHDPHSLLNLRSAIIDDHFDVAIGSRYASGVNVVNWPMGRVLMSFFASKYVQFVTSMPINDATAGFICYSRKVLETIDIDKIKFIGYAFQIEMKFKSWKFGFKIKEVPIIFTDRTKGTSKMSKRIFKEAFFGVIQLKMESWFTKYIRHEFKEAQQN